MIESREIILVAIGTGVTLLAFFIRRHISGADKQNSQIQDLSLKVVEGMTKNEAAITVLQKSVDVVGDQFKSTREEITSIRKDLTKMERDVDALKVHIGLRNEGSFAKI